VAGTASAEGKLGRVPLSEPLNSFWFAYETLAKASRETAWGLVVTDARYPRIYDANHAGVVDAHPGLTLRDIRDELLPELDAVGCPYEHIEFLDGDEATADCPAFRELRAAMPDSTPDALMVFEPGDVPEPAADARIAEEPLEDELWRAYRDSRTEFGEDLDEGVLDQLVERDRDVLVPAGLRIFAARVEGKIAGFASLMSMAGVGYVDNVVTLTAFRRRGIASAVVSRVVRASRQAGDELCFLFAENGMAPQRIYERLGFRTRQLAYGFTRPRS
jgi:ribosomal protein S18 acetylase RimI-like enzyme